MFYNHSKHDGQAKRKQPRRCQSWPDYRQARAVATGAPGIETDEILKEALEFSRRQMPPDLREVYLDAIARR